ncbi:hypothetical protein [Actinomadura luteofluorescens]|uniref:hypothetical protein n=1 Tax=Actinomadura luteofluorescens TaxID=46163 RepID=UPI003D8BDFA7
MTRTATAHPAARTRVPSTRPAALCPEHGCVLDEGPVHYRCPEGHAVMDADISREVTR